MRLIERVISSISNSKAIGYSEADVIRNMCPLELGFIDVDCKDDAGNFGLEGCFECWNRES
jgi:hypothetical protein